MPKTKDKKSEKKGGKHPSLRECFVAARDYLEGDKLEKQGKKKKSDASALITSEWERRGTDTITAEGLKVTRVQNSSMVYDGPGLWGDLTPRQRPLAFRRSFEITALPPARRVELMEAVKALLTPEEIKLCTNDVLDVQMLSEAVQAGRIKAEVVARHAEEKKSAPFIRVTQAGAE